MTATPSDLTLKYVAAWICGRRMPKRGYHHGNLKQALVEATLKLIEDKGPTGFTVAEAAKVAGVTPAAVYRHFDGREALIAECALQGHRIFGDLMEHAYADGRPTALKAFEATGRAYLAFARKFPGHYMAMFESGVNFTGQSRIGIGIGPLTWGALNMRPCGSAKTSQKINGHQPRCSPATSGPCHTAW